MPEMLESISQTALYRLRGTMVEKYFDYSFDKALDYFSLLLTNRCYFQ
ncbi:hypothetical protein [Calothrix sp. NIES-2100]